MNQQIIEKIQKTSKKVLLVTNIAKIFCIVMGVLIILAGIICLATANQINEQMANEISNGTVGISEVFGGMSAEMARDILENGYTAYVFVAYIATGGFILFGLAAIFHLIGKVFKDLRESYSPFVPSIIKDLKIVFIIITVISVLNSLLIGLITGLALWCVLHIFEYGCELQKLSDETL